MHTTSHSASNVRRRRPHRLSFYFLGRKAEVWLASYDHRTVHHDTEGVA